MTRASTSAPSASTPVLVEPPPDCPARRDLELFGPGDLMWELNGHWLLAASTGSAFILQLMHPVCTEAKLRAARPQGSVRYADRRPTNGHRGGQPAAPPAPRSGRG
jgi:hypothetical protein